MPSSHSLFACSYTLSSDDTYDTLRDNLTGRICDKEPSIRAQAVVGLSKLIGTEDVDELKKGEKTILEMVIETMCHDTAP